ncbi:hypothetical protein ABZV96_37125, partial [Streptomyces misionensis]
DGVGGAVAREAVALLGPGGRHLVFDAPAPRERWRVAAPPAHPAYCAGRVTVRSLRSRTSGTLSRCQAFTSLQSGSAGPLRSPA